MSCPFIFIKIDIFSIVDKAARRTAHPITAQRSSYG